MERTLDEWAYEFSLVPVGASDVDLERVAEEVLMEATRWAEQRQYGIGGGFEVDGGRIRYFFGLTCTRSDQSIPEPDAAELLEFIDAVSELRRCALEGRFRPFEESEGD